MYSLSIQKYVQTSCFGEYGRQQWFSLTEDEVIAQNKLIWVSSFMWVKRLWNKKATKRKKTDFNSTCPIQTVYEGSRLWQLWHMRSTLDEFQKSNNSREIQYRVHINTLLFLELTEMDVCLNVVRDPVFVRGDTCPGRGIAAAAAVAVVTCGAESGGMVVHGGIADTPGVLRASRSGFSSMSDSCQALLSDPSVWSHSLQKWQKRRTCLEMQGQNICS